MPKKKQDENMASRDNTIRRMLLILLAMLMFGTVVVYANGNVMIGNVIIPPPQPLLNLNASNYTSLTQATLACALCGNVFVINTTVTYGQIPGKKAGMNLYYPYHYSFNNSEYVYNTIIIKNPSYICINLTVTTLNGSSLATSSDCNPGHYQFPLLAFGNHFGVTNTSLTTVNVIATISSSLIGGQTVGYTSVVKVGNSTLFSTSSLLASSLIHTYNFQYSAGEALNITLEGSGNSNYTVDDPVVTPSGTLYYQQLSIKNPVASAYTVNTPIGVIYPANSFNTYLASNMMNIEAFNGVSGSVLPMWIEGNILSETVAPNLFNSADILLWIKVPDAIASSSTDSNIYLAYMSTGTNNYGANLGAAPQLFCGGGTCPGSAYNGGDPSDVANVVFSAWCPFGGSLANLAALPSECQNWNKISNPTLTFGANALQIIGTGNAQAINMLSSNKPSYPFDMDMFGTIYGNGGTSTGSGFGYYASGLGGDAFIDTFSPSSDYRIVAGAGTAGGTSAIVSSTSNQIFTGNFEASGTAGASIGYNPPASSNTPMVTLITSITVPGNYLTFETYGSGQMITVFWDRTRIEPPKNVNAIITFGAVTATAPTVTITSPSNAIVDVGQYETFNAVVSGGNSPFTYNFFIANSVTPGTYNVFKPGYNGITFLVNAQMQTNSIDQANIVITDTTPSTANSVATPFTVNTALGTPSITTISNTLIDSGQYSTFTPSCSGGSIPYVENIIISNAVTNAPVNSIQVALTSCAKETFFFPSILLSNTLQANIVITDSATTNEITTSSYYALGFNSIPVASAITPASPTIDNGQSITLSSTASSGTGALTINWFFNSQGTLTCNPSNSLGTGTTKAVSPTSSNSYSYNVVDSATTPSAVCSASDAVTVNPATSINVLTETNTVINSGQYSRLAGGPVAATGTPTYTINWFSQAACAGSSFATGTTTLVNPLAATTYSYNVVDSAYVPTSVCSASNTVNVNGAPPSITFSANEMIYNTIFPIVVSTSPSGDTANVYMYQPGQTPSVTGWIAQGTAPFTYNLCSGNNFCPTIGYWTINVIDATSGVDPAYNFLVYAPIYFQNVTITSNTPAYNNVQACTNTFTGGSCVGAISFTNNVVLTKQLFVVGDITVGAGNTLWTNGYPIIASNMIKFTGAYIQTNTIPQPALALGQSAPYSFGGSGGGSASGNGGNTLVNGGFGSGQAGSTPSAPTVNPANIITWFESISTYLSGAGGSSTVSPGGYGAYGAYLQSNTILEGTLILSGSAGGSSGGGSGGGGAGIGILAFNALYTPGTNVITGGAAGGGSGGAGGNGRVLVYRYITPPISAYTYTTYFPYLIYTNTLVSSGVTFTANQLFNGITTNLVQSSLTDFADQPSATQLSGLYQYTFTEQQYANSIVLHANVSTNMTDVNSILTFNTPIIAQFPNFLLTPSFVSTAQTPASYYLASDYLGNQHSNTITGDQWSNANTVFPTNLVLAYTGFNPFTVNIVNNPNVQSSITQNAFCMSVSNSVAPAAPCTRILFNLTTYDQRTFNRLTSNDSIAVVTLFNNYTSSNIVTYAYNAVTANAFYLYMSLSNYQNPSIVMQSTTLTSTANSHFQGINNECPTTLANGATVTYHPYLVDLNGSLYTYNIYAGYTNGGIGDFMQVYSGTSSLSSTLVQQYAIASNPFAQPLENGGSYAFHFLNGNCHLINQTAYSVWTNPITINLPQNTTVPLITYPNVTINCIRNGLTGPPANKMNVVCTGSSTDANVSDEVNSWVLSLYNTSLLGWNYMYSNTINSTTLAYTYNGLSNKTVYRVTVQAKAPGFSRLYPFDFLPGSINNGLSKPLRALITIIAMLVGLGITSAGEQNGVVPAQHVVSSTLIMIDFMFILMWMLGIATFIAAPYAYILMTFLLIVALMSAGYESGYVGG